MREASSWASSRRAMATRMAALVREILIQCAQADAGALGDVVGVEGPHALPSAKSER